MSNSSSDQSRKTTPTPPLIMSTTDVPRASKSRVRTAWPTSALSMKKKAVRGSPAPAAADGSADWDGVRVASNSRCSFSDFAGTDREQRPGVLLIGDRASSG
jgi:hypothetical protein